MHAACWSTTRSAARRWPSKRQFQFSHPASPRACLLCQVEREYSRGLREIVRFDRPALTARVRLNVPRLSLMIAAQDADRSRARERRGIRPGSRPGKANLGVESNGQG